MILIDTKKALSLIKEPKPKNLARELIRRFNVLVTDKIILLDSILYYSKNTDLTGIDRNLKRYVERDIRHLKKEANKSFKRFDKNSEIIN